jgi:hypothetical protein
MRRRWFMLAALSLSLSAIGQGRQEPRFVLLPASEAVQIGSKNSWSPTTADIEGLEANLSHISKLPSRGWKPTQFVLHPDRYFRQYVAVVNAGERKIFINAMCDVSSTPDWRTRIILTADGGSCFWYVTYDPATKKFSGLEINGRG